MGARADFAQFAVGRVRNADKTWDSLAKMSIPDAIAKVSATFALDPLSDQTTAGLTAYLAAERAHPEDGSQYYWQQQNLLTMGLLAPEMHLS
jgi:hypothetical protein